MALIVIYTALPNNGKTTAALEDMNTSKAVFFVPSPRNKNEWLMSLPYVYGAELKADDMYWLQQKYKQFRVVLLPGQVENITKFMGDEWDGWLFGFDDFPQLCPDPSDARKVGEFIAGIRHRDGAILITTHRVKGTVSPLVRNMADKITQVGPLVAKDEARTLYEMGGCAVYPEFDDFYAAISKNPKYAQFTVKDT